MVERFGPKLIGAITFLPDTDGEWVKASDYDALAAELAQVKAESLRVVKVDDGGDWYMTPDGLGIAIWDDGEIDYVKTPVEDGYHAWGACECEPVCLVKWEDEG